MKGRQHLTNRPKRNWIAWILLGLLALSGLAFSAWQSRSSGQNANAQAASTYQTTTVRRGDLSLSASGSGNLIAAQTVDLEFASTGKIASLNVQLGDTVKTGQVLAELDGIEQLKVMVQNQQLAVMVAQQALDDLQASADLNVAEAQATQASSQIVQATAEAGAHYKGDPRCAPSLTEEYFYKWLYAQQPVNFWQGQLDNPKTGYGQQYILQNLKPAKRTLDLAYYNYVWCQGYTDQEIQASQANLQVAQADAAQAAKNYQTIQSNQGIDPKLLQLDQAQLKNAQAQLAKAQADLAGATIISPLDGVVTAVNGAAGQAMGKGAIITISDVSHPLITVNIDETDLQNFAAGCPVQATFDALPNQAFPGVIDQVSPSLVTSNNTSTVQGQAVLNPLPAGVKTPLLGANASLTVTCKSAQNVLLVPLQALYEPAGQPAYVYVLDGQGQPVKKVVEVGLKSTAFAEIRSGVSQGDRVVTTPIKQP